MATIKDIASRAKVSVATVSYVINNTRPVHPEKRERVLQAIKELNYVPNAAARSLRAKKSKTIGLVIPDLMNPFYPDLAKGCQDALQESGYTIMMFNTNEKENQLDGIANQIREGKVDGLIFSNLLPSDKPVLRELVKESYPLVILHRKIGDFSIDSVTTDNFDGAYMATDHLMSLGHKRIAYISGSDGSPASIERTNGYLAAMKKANLLQWIVSGKSLYQTSYTEALLLLKLPIEERPTAIFTGSDIMALGVMDAAKDLNLSIPEDISVIGFDDLFFASSRSVQLSTVKVPRYEMGKLAANILVDKIKEKNESKSKSIILPTSLIIRNTSGRVKN